MTQILDDLEALWFPVNDQARELDKKTFPAFMGLATAHPNAATLEALYLSEDRDGLTICNLLDEMNIRPRLMALALDHRDAALAILAAPGFNPDGRFILQTWLDWYLQAGRSLLEPVP
jgi:geranylgeranyl pyrophosphate synthase